MTALTINPHLVSLLAPSRSCNGQVIRMLVQGRCLLVKSEEK